MVNEIVGAELAADRLCWLIDGAFDCELGVLLGACSFECNFNNALRLVDNKNPEYAYATVNCIILQIFFQHLSFCFVTRLAIRSSVLFTASLTVLLCYAKIRNFIILIT